VVRNMGDRIGGAKLMVNLHIAIYFVFQWAARGTRMIASIQSSHGQAQAQNVSWRRKRLLLGVCRRLTLSSARSGIEALKIS
jgi:hypothetical protein